MNESIQKRTVDRWEATYMWHIKKTSEIKLVGFSKFKETPENPDEVKLLIGVIKTVRDYIIDKKFRYAEIFENPRKNMDRDIHRPLSSPKRLLIIGQSLFVICRPEIRESHEFKSVREFLDSLYSKNKV